ncbi:MAG TPA: 5-formyltetrahydrofolate cyclo-ligase [Bacilli bacterium]
MEKQSAMAKQELRARMKELRSQLSPFEASAKSAAICETARHWVARHARRKERDSLTVFTYIPFRQEVDVKPLIAACFEFGCRIAAPRVDKPARRMEPVVIQNLHELVVGNWGMLEPPADKPILSENEPIDLILVPGVAFDRAGHRLGYGGGFYDRFLASYRQRHGSLPMCLALAYSLQIVEHLPNEAHDVPVDLIITENEMIFRPKQEEGDRHAVESGDIDRDE